MRMPLHFQHSCYQYVAANFILSAVLVIPPDQPNPTASQKKFTTRNPNTPCMRINIELADEASGSAFNGLLGASWVAMRTPPGALEGVDKNTPWSIRRGR
jgi:hypothetical protein